MSVTARRRPFGDIANTYSANRQTDRQNKPPTTSSRRPTQLIPSPRIDEKNKSDPLHVTEYLKEIFTYYRQAEVKYRPSTTYMTRIQTDVNEKMRTILIDWLVDVHLKFKLLPETLYLAVDSIDRFLDRKVVSRQKLQLVGVVAMLLAAKYEEIYPPEVKEFIYIAANTYTREDILRMERLMFATLDFNITVPTVYAFFKRALHVMEADVKTGQMAQYLSELSLLDYKFLQYNPSLVGASVVYLANKFLSSNEPWSPVMQHYTGYTVLDMEACCQHLITTVQNAGLQKTKAVLKKYSLAKHGEVAKLVPHCEIAGPLAYPLNA